MTLVHITTVPVSLAFFRGQVAFMKSRGLDVHAVSSPGEKLDQFGERERVPVHAVPMVRRITPFQDIASLRALVRALRSVRPAIVHAHTPKGGLLGMIAAWITRTPVRVYHIRGLPYMTATGRKRRLLQLSERVACRLAHQVISVSDSIRDVAIQDGVCPPEKIKVLLGGSGNGVDATDRFNPERFPDSWRESQRAVLGIGRDDLVIGFVGRVVRDKGIHELAHAWRHLRESHPSAHLLVAGPLEPQDPIDPDVLDDLERDPRVHLLGSVTDPSELYPLLDLVVLPTYREGFPNVPLEGAAMQLPVVATRIPGCIDAVEDGVTGTLVPVQDAEALEAAIRGYLDDPDLRRRHGIAGRERVLRDFRQEAIWEALFQEYSRLLEARGPPPSFGAQSQLLQCKGSHREFTRILRSVLDQCGP